MTDPDIAAVVERVRYHLDKYDTMAGPIHHNIIHAFVDSELRASDLRALLAAALAGVAAGPQATPQVLATHETVAGPDLFDETRSHLGINLDVPPGTRVRVVAAPTSQEDDHG